ncbi:hypothetical protein BJ165DRAFT_1532138 [Panaeolus papilionaceus]|nr:hypothetical protein BJ165DRAFT_1532138 [Panaeolus papilionaceus]
MLNSSFYAPSSRSGSPVPSSPPNPSQPIVDESYTTNNECHCKNQLAHWDMDGNIHPDLRPGCRRALELEGHLNNAEGISSTSVVATVDGTSDRSRIDSNNPSNNEIDTRSSDNDSDTISTMSADVDSTELPNASAEPAFGSQHNTTCVKPDSAERGGPRGKQRATERAEEMTKRKRDANSDDGEESTGIPAYKKEKVSLKI